MGGRGIPFTGRDVYKMDTDLNIFHRQMQKDTKQRYILWKRLDELLEEVEEIKEKLKKFE